MTLAADALAGFHAAVAEWFRDSFAAPTRPQQRGWPAIATGASTLILAPTGSGKTLAAFLAAIDRLMFSPLPDKTARCRVVYISPLKALAVDVERNLRAPIVGIGRAADRAGVTAHLPDVAIRTGDTPARERARFVRQPTDILVTTPESLFLMLTGRARETLRSVEVVIIDEIHALAGSKRGAHLALSLERLEEVAGRPLQRIGLSATQRPLDEVARFLGGWRGPGEPRPVTVIDASEPKRFALRVEVPVEDMARLGEPVALASGPASEALAARTSIWPAVHPLIVRLIREHRSTLVFVNSRRLAERLASALNEVAGEALVHAHHGSVAREQRLRIEDDLKAGRIAGLVATSSLELGIDMGAIDLVVQVEAPPSVASGIQRIGRSGHQAGAVSSGVIVPKYRGDLLACAALTERMLAGAVEPVAYPRNPLDVLAQQIVACVVVDEWPVERLAALVRRSAPFAELSVAMFEQVLDMLAGRYASDDLAALRPRIVWDRTLGTVRAREGAQWIAVANAGTIPDRGLFGVFLVGGEAGARRVGELDEEMVFESRVGETFLLGASTWRIEEITHDRVLVSPAPGLPGKMPFWKGESAVRPLEFGRAIGALARTLRALPRGKAEQRLTTDHALEPVAARNLLAYLDEQAAESVVPDDRTIVVERCLDELGDWRVCVLSPFGGRVHAPWAMAIAALERERTGAAPDVYWTDDGIVVRFPEADHPPPVERMLPDPDAIDDLVRGELSASALFAGRFREAAGRALLLPRRFPGQRAALWQNRRRAADLLVAAQAQPSFPILLETYRECLRDVFDMTALHEVLRQVRDRTVRVATADTPTPSPFAASLLFNYVATFIYDTDAPAAERRAQALTVDPAQLRDLLGDIALRELLEAEVIDEVERELQALAPSRAARGADAAHDLLLRLGDLGPVELTARSADGAPVGEWIAALLRDRRALMVGVGGEQRLIAVEDAARYRDALGAAIPAGVPAALLEPVTDALGDLVRRYARTHGPFTAGELAARLGLGVAAAESALRAQSGGGMLEGAFRPSGQTTEWCDPRVLAAIRQRSLARLRREVAPVDPPALARLLESWHRLDRPGIGTGALLEVVADLEGAAIPASDLESRILPDRVRGYDPRDLDALLASGEVIWTGAGALGARDGRIALFRAESAALLHTPAGAQGGELHERIRARLGERGALFFPALVEGLGAFPPEAVQALWDLVWAGEVTNDTFAPVRAFLDPRGGRPRRGRPPVRAIGAGRGDPRTAGRWSLIEATGDAAPRALARVESLLRRHAVLTRDAVQAEELPGGFAAAYGILRTLEEAGRVRRGYFIAGRGAAQFALPGAADRLRELREPPLVPSARVLAASDPAQPYGAALPWPVADPTTPATRRPMRTAGALVITVDGVLAGWLAPGHRALLTFLSTEATRAHGEALAGALAAEAGGHGRRALLIERIDGQAAAAHPLAGTLRGAGFATAGDGLLRRAPRDA